MHRSIWKTIGVVFLTIIATVIGVTSFYLYFKGDQPAVSKSEAFSVLIMSIIVIALILLCGILIFRHIYRREL